MERTLLLTPEVFNSCPAEMPWQPQCGGPSPMAQDDGEKQTTTKTRQHKGRSHGAPFVLLSIWLLNLYEVAFAVACSAGCDGRVLRGAPVVDVAYLVHAGDGAVGSAGFLGKELALYDLGGIFGDRNARIAALLGAVGDDPFLVDIEVAGTRAAA